MKVLVKILKKSVWCEKTRRMKAWDKSSFSQCRGSKKILYRQNWREGKSTRRRIYEKERGRMRINITGRGRGEEEMLGREAERNVDRDSRVLNWQALGLEEPGLSRVFSHEDERRKRERERERERRGSTLGVARARFFRVFWQDLVSEALAIFSVSLLRSWPPIGRHSECQLQVYSAKYRRDDLRDSAGEREREETSLLVLLKRGRSNDRPGEERRL